LSDDPATATTEAAGDQKIRALVTRLARPHASGGDVIERSVILAEGGDFSAVVAWIAAHNGVPDATAASAPKGGLHGARLSDGASTRPPLRYVMPVGVLH
jgi:hypothetical protein